MSKKIFYLSQNDKKVAGVCGGIAEYFDWDSTLVRIVVILFIVLSSIVPGLIAYIIIALISPKQPHKTDKVNDKVAD